MEDLENHLSTIGYRAVQESAECGGSRGSARQPQLRGCDPPLREGIRRAARLCGCGCGGSAAPIRRRSIEYVGPCRVEQTPALQGCQDRGEMGVGRAFEPFEPVLIEEGGQRGLIELRLPDDPEQ